MVKKKGIKKKTAKKSKTHSVVPKITIINNPVHKKARPKKKSIGKKSVQKIVHKTIIEKDKSNEKILIENFVSLQKVMVNLSVKFDSLATNISKLLNLFEISAKALAEKDFNFEKRGEPGNKGDEQRIMNKVEELFEQNKVIARGLTLMHDKISGQEGQVSHSQRLPPVEPKNIQRPMQRNSPPTNFNQNKGTGNYQKSVC